MYTWNFAPSLVFGLTFQAIAYLACIGPLRHLFPGSEPVPKKLVLAFMMGLLTFFIALVSPIDRLGESYLLTIHMVQHILITLVGPPLLLMGLPRWMLRPLLYLPFALPIGRFITNNIFAFIVFNVVLIGWHFPVLYDAALQNIHIHILEHIMFIVTAMITWLPIISPFDELPPSPPAIQCMYLFLQSLPPTLLGAVITFSNTIIYPTYAEAPRIWGLSPMLDQQLGGLVMWVPGGLIFLFALSIIFFRWFGRDEYEMAGDGFA
ncbi:MAG: hypothetical protein GFH27_549301n230 [Chloroflexi bacterium AL-W]|nr:hypothetical protein [Chloroflexi bacterium AL-W]